MNARARVAFRGKVQGVFFRAYVKERADLYEVKGTVRNLPEGEVEAIFEGEKKDIENLIHDCQHKHPRAKVEKLNVKWETYTGDFDSFEVLL